MVTRAAYALSQQTSDNFRFIVSDNSSNEEPIHALSKLNPSLTVVKRERNLEARLHWRRCVMECDTTYIGLIHDDDEIYEDYVDKFWAHEKQIERFSAIGMNADIFLNEQKQGTSFRALRNIEGPFFAKEILDMYFGKFGRGIVPFPGYIFRTDFLKLVELEKNYGKYGDVRILVELTKNAGIYRIEEPTFAYHIHGLNDGLTESMTDRFRFLAYLKTTAKGENLTRQLSDYRFFLYKKILHSQGSKRKKPYRLMTIYQLRYRIYRLFRMDLFPKLAKKLYLRLI